MLIGGSPQEFLEKVKEAIANGSNVNDDSRSGHRPLQLAIRMGYEEVALLLIESGADIHYRDSWNDPIHTAINCGQFRIARVLIDHGAHFNRWNSWGYDYRYFYEFCRSYI